MSSANAFSANRQSENSKIEQLLNGLNDDELSEEDIRKLLTVAVKAYFSKLEEGEFFPPFNDNGNVTASEVMSVVSQMMRQVNVELFELGLWQSWTKN